MGVFNDMTGVISNSNEDLERPDRALGAARLWLDPRINMHNNQRPQINAFNDYVPDKSIGARPCPGKEVVFSLTLGFSNHEAPKPMNLDAHNIST
ncbi:non-specific serine/threonine protein kinase [Trifolium repens]|nr:non-specific serine/threonine protein kinase [Trifolium repens]